MPQYYEPLLEFLRVHVAIFIRDFVVTGRVPLHDFLYPKVEVICSLTHSACTPVCKYFVPDKPCKYQTVKWSAYTIGVVYTMIQINNTQLVEDRDFYTAVHTGKLYSEMLSDWEPYDFVERVRSSGVSNIRFKPLNVSDTNPVKYPHIYDYIKSLNKKRKNELESISKLIDDFEEREGKVPDNLIRLQKELSNEIKSHNQLPATTLIGIITTYIDKGDQSYKLVKEVIKYFIQEFTPTRDDDFPYGSLKPITDTTIRKLVSQTNSLPDDHPFKWTDERRKKFEQEQNPYKKLVIASDTLYTWSRYIVPSAIKLTDQLIRAKYLFDQILSTSIVVWRTELIIYKSDFCNARKAYRLYKVFSYIFDTVGYTASLFVPEEALEWQAILKPDADYNYHIRALNEVLTHHEDTVAQKYFELMKDNLRPCKLILKNIGKG